MHRRRPSSEPVIMTYHPTFAIPSTSAIRDENEEVAPRKSREARRSSVRVSVDYFDPAGVQELQRNISLSEDRRHSRRQSKRYSQLQATVPADSAATLIPENDPFDFEKMLKFIQGKLEEAEVEGREIGVAFQDLRVVGLGASASYQPTLGSVLSPFAIFETISAMRRPPLRNILEGFSGVVRPGEMLLVLGRPGSGCSTLLKTLANQTDEYHSVTGNVHYDAISPLDLRKHYRGDVQYCPEDDLHFPTLSVEQTLQFATRLRAPRAKTRMIGQSRTEYVDTMVEMLLTIFGLRGVRGTPVGDSAIRGVSGGQKKRVSIAEALATRMRIGAWDNSTRGLDSSTALEFGRALRIATDVGRLTTIVSIYQASESLYALFDKVCVLSEGKMVYFGRADQARDYFLSLGYVPQAERQTTADFLVSVTDPVGRIIRPGLTLAEDRARPRTSADLAKHFLESRMMANNLEDIAEYNEECSLDKDRAQKYQRSAEAEHANWTRRSSAYMTSLAMQTRALTLRRVQIITGFPAPTVVNLMSFFVQGVITGTVFLKAPESTSAFYSRGGVIFFALMFSAIASMAEIAALFQQRPIVLRQFKAALYHPFVEAVALTLVDLPITFVTMAVFAVTIYFLVGLQRTVDQFFIFFLFLLMMAITMKAFFRATAAAFKSIANAQAASGLMVLALVVYTGYTLPKRSMIGALRWITYINPLRYGFEGVMANEFHTLKGSCANLVPQGPGYENITLANQVCAAVGSVAGQNFVDGGNFIAISYGYFLSNQWLNVGLVATFGIAFLLALFAFTEFNTALSTDTPVVLFKRGLKKAAAFVDNKGQDVEMANINDVSVDAIRQSQSKVALAGTSRMTDIFSWQNVNYDVPVEGGTKKLLDNVSGFVAPGTLTALMGESGAGKTTLLNVLAERTTTGVVQGDRFVNGHPLPFDFRSQTGYVQQMDTHVPTDTVREALLFSAKLRQPASVPWAEKIAYVETCLAMCGLEAVADASVGSLGIEHRKRTTIGVELAAKPKLLLFLDEPTSGLDSQSAWAIMLFLKQLAANGQAILCTIHQPSAELFEMFDRLLLLRKGGQMVYFGDIGQDSTTLLRYFEFNGSRPCQPSENPAEYMLDVIGAGATASSAQDWEAVWRRSSESKRAQEDLDRIHADGRNRGAVQANFTSTFATGWMTQTTSLFKRDFRARWRDPTYLLAKMVLNVGAGLFLGFTFYKSNNSQQGTQNQLFAVFMSTILAAPMVNQLQVPFLNMRSIYEIREGPTKFYSWTALITSQLFSDLPWNILASSLYFFCWYWTVGFDSSRAPFTYLMLGIVFPTWYTTLGQATAAMAPNVEIAGVLFSFLFSFVSTFAGVVQPLSQLGWWKWMWHVSPFTYLIEGVLGQAIGGKSMQCSAVELVSVNPPDGKTCGQYFASYMSFAGGYLTNADATSGCQFCSTATTDQFLGGAFNILFKNHWRDAGLMCAYIGFNVICLYFFTWFIRIRK
ncbi:Pleiotropic drug resistance ABC transporter [Mycena venus]|uniref:Pleiotropic drug resistance ABC transporter n=1 Tax=Mycena venus TaxID=2733690 RepID=A0A8H6YJ88_9AGAR|nr:Pleiotropic drug resistance ABC transporter [Mycena venus]